MNVRPLVWLRVAILPDRKNRIVAGSRERSQVGTRKSLLDQVKLGRLRCGLVETYYQPVWSIGGDYGLVTPGGDSLDVLVCDVSGHGISSALVANRIYSETMAQIEQGAELGSMLRHLNHFVVQHLANSAFYFTVAAARFSRTRSTMQFAGAGHPPAMLIRQGDSPRLLESRSTVLGLFEDAVASDATIETSVLAGDRVMVYTDGLTEAFNPQEEMLGACSAVFSSTAPLSWRS